MYHIEGGNCQPKNFIGTKIDFKVICCTKSFLFVSEV